MASAIAATACGLAGASTISYVTSTPVVSALTDWSSSLAFTQFNPSLGTLLGVELDLHASFTTTLTVTNTSDTASSGTADTEVRVTVNDPSLLFSSNSSSFPELDLISGDFPYSLAGGGQITSGLMSKSGSDDEIYSASGILSEFTGTGNITLPASTFTRTLLGNTGGNTTSAQVTNASATGTVIYTYQTSTATPEPATEALMGGALLALGLFGKRLKKS